MSKIDLIKVEKFGKFLKHSKEFTAFCKLNNIAEKKMNTAGGQVLALMTCKKNFNKHIDRAGLIEFIDKIGEESGDVIQLINKTDQWGLVAKTIDRKYYTIPFPFQYIDLHLKKRDINIGGLDRNERINLVKEFLIKNYIEVPNDKWQVGHLNPNIPDGSSDKLVFQPPIQGKYRDKFIFDEMGLMKYPTPQELKNNFEKYYSEGEMLEIYEILKKRLQL